jgi:hypothetical protein
MMEERRTSGARAKFRSLPDGWARWSNTTLVTRRAEWGTSDRKRKCPSANNDKTECNAAQRSATQLRTGVNREQRRCLEKSEVGKTTWQADPSSSSSPQSGWLHPAQRQSRHRFEQLARVTLSHHLSWPNQYSSHCSDQSRVSSSLGYIARNPFRMYLLWRHAEVNRKLCKIARYKPTTCASSVVLEMLGSP